MSTTIVVGTNSYLSLADANTYVGDNYISTSAEYVAWNALSDANKELLLKKACKKIDRQILQGIKTLPTQTLEFPRAIRTDYYNVNYPQTQLRFTADWVVETAVAPAVTYAQVEESISMLIIGSAANQRAELQRQGVKSFSLGNLSESYGSGKVSSYPKLLSTEATDLIRHYLLGSVSIA